MSILIKGMKMPAAGAYTCELGVIDENTATLTIHTPINESQRSYKLVTIPTHGDLIDRDKVVEGLAGWILKLANTYGKNDEYVRCLEEVCEILGQHREVIPAER